MNYESKLNYISKIAIKEHVFKDEKVDDIDFVNDIYINELCSDDFKEELYNPIYDTYQKIKNKLISFDAKKIHSLIIPNEGIRTTRAKPNKSNNEYVKPELINIYLSILFNWYLSISFKSLHNLIFTFVIFYVEFLNIHPFYDGNGRTARLLLQYMMKDLSMCFIIGNDRDKFIELLEERNHEKIYDFVCSHIKTI